MSEVKVYEDKYPSGNNGERYFGVEIDGKRQSKLFLSEGMAFIYGGLIVSDLSMNDCSYMSNYIESMVEGTKERDSKIR